jgi:tetratricopeptide (TPR) repeat protein
MGIEEAGMDRRRRFRRVALALALLGLLAAAVLAWTFRDHLRSPQALYREAQTASPQRAVVLYGRLGERLPQIEEYARLWAAEAAMPEVDALRALQSVAAFRPQSPAAYQAHLTIARYYASIEAPQAEDAYRAALALQDTVALRLELARYLEERGDDDGAYAEYLDILGERPDAFAGMRRTGRDPLVVADWGATRRRRRPTRPGWRRRPTTRKRRSVSPASWPAWDARTRRYLSTSRWTQPTVDWPRLSFWRGRTRTRPWRSTWTRPIRWPGGPPPGCWRNRDG